MENDANVASKGFYLFNREQKPEESDVRPRRYGRATKGDNSN